MIIITLSIYIIYCFHFHGNTMFKCVECGTRIELTNPEQGTTVDCPGCGIDLELVGSKLVGLQLGPSEE